MDKIFFMKRLKIIFTITKFLYGKIMKIIRQITIKFDERFLGCFSLESLEIPWTFQMDINGVKPPIKKIASKKVGTVKPRTTTLGTKSTIKS
jgi:hypothetical protein